jgi:hypothetical protein
VKERGLTKENSVHKPALMLKAKRTLTSTKTRVGCGSDK